MEELTLELSLNQLTRVQSAEREKYNLEWESNGSIIISTVLNLVRTKSIKEVRGSFLQVFKQTDQHVHRKSVWPWHLGREPSWKE